MSRYNKGEIVLVPNVLSGGTGYQYGRITGMKSIGPENKFNGSAIKKRRGCSLEIDQEGEGNSIMVSVPLAVLIPQGDGEDFAYELEHGRPREWLGRCIGVVITLEGRLTLCYGQVVKVSLRDRVSVFTVEFRTVNGRSAEPHEFEIHTIEDNEVRPLQMYLGLGQGPVTDERGAIAQMMALGEEIQQITSAKGFTAPNWLDHFPDADIMEAHERVLNTALVPDRMARLMKKQQWIQLDPASITKKTVPVSSKLASPVVEKPIMRTLFAPEREEPRMEQKPTFAGPTPKPRSDQQNREDMFDEFCRFMEKRNSQNNKSPAEEKQSATLDCDLTAEQQVVRSKKSFIPTMDQLERHSLVINGNNYGKCFRPAQATGVVERVFEDMQTILRSREAAQVVAVTWFDGRVHHAPMSAFKNNKSFELKFDQSWEQVIWSKNPKFEKEDLDDLSVFWECFHTMAMVAAKAYISEYGNLLEIVRQQLNVAVHHLGGMVAFTRLRRSSRVKVLQLAALFIRSVMDTFVRTLQVTRKTDEALIQGKGASEGMQHFQNGLVSSLQAIQIEDLQFTRSNSSVATRNADKSNGNANGKQARLPEELKRVVPMEEGKRLCLKSLTKDGCSRTKCHFAHATRKIDLPEELSSWMTTNYGPLKQ